MDKSSFGYFIVKPDGAKDINGILDDIEDKFDEDMIRYYKIDNFDEVVNELYYKHFDEKGDKFKKSFADYLRALKEIYGNSSLLVLIKSNNKDYDDLGKGILDKKMELRQKFAKTDIAVVTNNTELDASNRIVLTDLDFNSMKQRIFKEPGNYRISDFNVIHSPDSDQETVKDELKILYKIGVLKSENMLDKNIIDTIRKYKTFEVLNVDKREIGIEYPSMGEHMMNSIRRGY